MLRKIGIHIISGFSGGLGHLPLYVLVNVTPQYVRDVRARVGPDPLIVVRWVQQYQPLTNPEQEAVEWFSAHLGDMLLATDNGADKRIVWQGMNEIPGCQAEALYLYERRRGQLMHPRGLLRGLFACSVGEYHPSVWTFLAGLFPGMVAGEHILVHEYWDRGESIPGRDWWVARWKHVPELAGVPIAVTECGRDYIIDGGVGYGKAGWRQTCNRETFQQDLAAYDALLRQYPNVVGGAVFNCGFAGQWVNFASDEIVPWMVANTEQGGAPVPETPQPEQKPKVVFPLLNTHKAWYSADALFGEYDGHPQHARDINRESFGDTDRGEPVVAPFDGFIVDCGDYGLNYGWIVSVLSLDSLDKTPDLNMCRLRHLQNVVVKKGDIVKAGDPIGEIGKAAPTQAAHLHLEMWIVRIPTPRQDWRSTEWKVPDPVDWFRWHGVSAELLDRLTKFDGR